MREKSLLLSFLIFISVFSGCAPRDNYLKKLAQDGKINEKAPLLSMASVEIESSAANIWDILITVKQWPSWNPKVTAVKANGVIFDGDAFGWVMGKKVYSTVLCFEKNKKIAWFSTSMAYRSVMKWELEEVGKNKTRVTITESRDGFFMNFMSGKKHKSLIEEWLQNLKNRAEVVVM